MELFHVVDDAYVILRVKGVYKQAKLYRRGSEAYAGLGGGFVRLLASGGTSAPSVSWVDAHTSAARVGNSMQVAIEHKPAPDVKQLPRKIVMQVEQPVIHQ